MAWQPTSNGSGVAVTYHLTSLYTHTLPHLCVARIGNIINVAAIRKRNGNGVARSNDNVNGYLLIKQQRNMALWRNDSNRNTQRVMTYNIESARRSVNDSNVAAAASCGVMWLRNVCGRDHLMWRNSMAENGVRKPACVSVASM